MKAIIVTERRAKAITEPNLTRRRPTNGRENAIAVKRTNKVNCEPCFLERETIVRKTTPSRRRDETFLLAIDALSFLDDDRV